MFLFEEGLSIFGIRLYAICILIGIIIAVYMGIKEGKKLGINPDFVYTGVIIIVPLAIIGARLWYILFNLDESWSFAKIIGLEGGLAGLAIQGGVIAAIISVYFYCKKRKVSLYKVVDIVAPGFLIGQICGRWGNFFNKELYGPIVENTKLFEIIFPTFISDNMYINGAFRHPTFLYESLLNLVGLIIMLVLRKKSKKLLSGDLVGIYLIWYGCVRIFTETLRSKSGANEILKLGPIPVSIFVSCLFIIGGIAFLILKRKFGPKDKYQDILKYVDENRIDTVLFDLDGTLLNTRRLIDNSFIHTFKKFRPGITLTNEDLDSFFGPTLKDTFKRYTDDPNELQEMMDYYRDYNIKNHNKDMIEPFDGAIETLKHLRRRGYKLGIVSSKRREIIMLGLELYNMSTYFDIIVAAEDVDNPKPAPDGILKAVRELECERNVLYVGDHPNDILAGKNANVKTCDLMYSSKFDECEKLEPNFCIKELDGLNKVLWE